MGKTALIACIDENGCIGNGKNGLINQIKEDMRRFQRLTKGCIIVMGMNTFKSLPSINRPLKGRANVVITSHPDEARNEYKFLNNDDTSLLFMSSLDEFLAVRETYAKDEDVVIIGGGQIYKEALEKMEFDLFYLTSTHSWKPGHNWLAKKDRLVHFPCQELQDNLLRAKAKSKWVTGVVYPKNSVLKEGDVEYKFFRIEVTTPNEEDGGFKIETVKLPNDNYYWENAYFDLL